MAETAMIQSPMKKVQKDCLYYNGECACNRVHGAHILVLIHY